MRHLLWEKLPTPAQEATLAFSCLMVAAVAVHEEAWLPLAGLVPPVLYLVWRRWYGSPQRE